MKAEVFMYGIRARDAFRVGIQEVRGDDSSVGRPRGRAMPELTNFSALGPLACPRLACRMDEVASVASGGTARHF
jgi:hypothetical protein